MGKCNIIEIVESKDQVLVYGNPSAGLAHLIFKHYTGSGYGTIEVESDKNRNATYVLKRE
jgi:hypothetical protein